jgi:putative FmdB family regulatory protein
MPIYEYRCPQGHTFEQFRRMSDPPPEVCEICGQGPVEIVLYPVAVHYKGSGFYSTDYGKGGRKPTKDDSKPADSGGGESKGETKKDEKKSAPAGDS